jgi:hypothetical protein
VAVAQEAQRAVEALAALTHHSALTQRQAAEAVAGAQPTWQVLVAVLAVVVQATRQALGVLELAAKEATAELALAEPMPRVAVAVAKPQ